MYKGLLFIVSSIFHGTHLKVTITAIVQLLALTFLQYTDDVITV